MVCPTCFDVGAGSLPAELSCCFPTHDNTEPPTSDDLAYVPMSSFGPESSLSPPTTSSFQHLQADGQVPELAFPSPFAVSLAVIPWSKLHPFHRTPADPMHMSFHVQAAPFLEA